MYNLFYTARGLTILAAVAIPSILALLIFHEAALIAASEIINLVIEAWLAIVTIVSAIAIIWIAKRTSS